MGNKSLWWALASLVTIVGASAAEQGAVYMDRYPSSSDIRRMQRQGVSMLVISPVDRVGSPATLNFPDLAKVNRLNDFDRASITVHPVTTNFPDPAPLNRLKQHVSVDGVIDNCLSSTNEKARLMRIQRPVTITVLCRTDNQVERAERLASEIMAESRVSVRVRRVRD